MGLRFANLLDSDCDRTPANLSERFSRDVSTSRGICIRDIALLCGGWFEAFVRDKRN
jgi:hypothetical protein